MKAQYLSTDKVNGHITPCALAGLQAMLAIIQAVAAHDDLTRIALCEHQIWTPLDTLLDLVCFPIDLTLKMYLLSTLAALEKSEVTALQLWEENEESQSVTTLPSRNAVSQLSSRDNDHVNITFDSDVMEQIKSQKPSTMNETEVNKPNAVVSCCLNGF